MATGYTADVADGTITTFPEFAIRCARAMGACITMRDDPSDAEIPKAFEPSNYHTEALDKARKELNNLLETDDKTKQALIDAKHKDAIRSYREYLVKHSAKQTRYEQMIEDTEAWTPPTSEHIGLKDFMLQQLRDSLSWDCSGSLLSSPKKSTIVVWTQAEEDRIRANIKYHEEGLAKEKERCNERTEWVNQLRDSL